MSAYSEFARELQGARMSAVLPEVEGCRHACVCNPVTFTYDDIGRLRTVVAENGRKVVSFYDLGGRVTRLTYPHHLDGSRSWVDYTYDAVGRTATAKDASTTFATFAYHADDLMKNATLGNGVLEAYTYNDRSWPTRIRDTNTPGGQTTYLDLAYSYDASGNVLSMGTASFTYDGLDRLKTASGSFGSHVYSYDGVGNRKAIDYGGATNRSTPYSLDYGSAYNGVSHTWTTNPATGQAWTVADVNALTAGIELDATNWNARVTQVFMTVRINGGDVVLRPNGPTAVAQWTKSGTGGANWDRVDEATSDADATYVWSSAAGTTDRYSFQDLGQTGTISYVAITAIGRVPSCPEPPCWANLRLVLGAPSASYTYADGPTGMNTLTSMVDRFGVTTSYTYDANGNVDTKTGGWTYEWNPENLMTGAKLNGVPQQAYAYDGLGRRVNVTGLSSTWTVSIVAGMDAIYEKNNTNAVTKYVYANGMRIAKINPDGGVHYYLGDHLGSTRKVLDSSRNTVFSTDYEPFGKPFAPSGAETFKYTMEKHDDPTGLVYLRARQYDPEIGRFVGADPVLGSLGMPQTLNRYTYVVNNPLKYIDPTGEFLQIIGGAIVGGLIGYGLCVWQTGGWTSETCGKAALIGAAVGAFAVATFGLGMAAFGVGATGGIAAGSLAAVGAGIATGAAVGAQSYFLASILGIGLGTMTSQDLSMQDFATSVGLGAAFGGLGGKFYNPKSYWGWPRSKLSGTPWDDYSQYLVDAGPARGGGQRLAFQTPRGYRVEYHTGHAAGPHTGPHYQIYGPTRVKPSGFFGYHSDPIAYYKPYDPLPSWLDLW